jgi:hypothetical protein
VKQEVRKGVARCGPAKMAATNKCLARSNKSRPQVTRYISLHPKEPKMKPKIQARIPNAMFLEIERAARHELISIADFSTGRASGKTQTGVRQKCLATPSIFGWSNRGERRPKNEALSNSTSVTAVTSFENRQVHRSSQVCTRCPRRSPTSVQIGAAPTTGRGPHSIRG